MLWSFGNYIPGKHETYDDLRMEQGGLAPSYILYVILWEMLVKVTELVSYWNCHVLIPMSCLVGPGINNDGCNSNYEGGVPVGA